eukprot:2764051-Lingulodinium_polyedra.AAC.1
MWPAAATRAPGRGAAQPPQPRQPVRFERKPQGPPGLQPEQPVAAPPCQSATGALRTRTRARRGHARPAA